MRRLLHSLWLTLLAAFAPAAPPEAVPVIGRGPGHALYTAWGKSGWIDSVCYGAELHGLNRLQFDDPAFGPVVRIQAHDWQDAMTLALAWQRKKGGR